MPDPVVVVRRRLLGGGLSAVLLTTCTASHAVADDGLWDALQQGGLVILLRHAMTTPGVGDPPGFKLGDCRTQRNLTDQGRAQAARLGEALRAHRVPVERVLSSPWCRCIETARLAFNGTPETSPALANLFGRPESREQLAELRKLLADFRARGNLVLVSHGSTIVAVTGVAPEPAEMVIVTPEGGGRFSVRGRLSTHQA
ncbi:MAG TPA: histidine phosphatase family protein [Burkholderiaceae bacterium]|nr:histidine phosphatase family protein [Burkholderiaceae bacterium]